MATSFVADSKGRMVIDKDPDAVLDYSFDWTAWLLDVTDTIASVSAVCVGVILDPGHNPTFSGGVATVWVKGGVVGSEEKPSLTCRIVTAAGRTDDRTVYFNMKVR